jgi:4'-phosphopantetheinyl transferase
MQAPDFSQLHLYELALDDGDIDAARALLSAAEHERAERFHFDLHRHRYIRGRAALREVLARYLATEPRAVRLRTLDFGKPVLVPDGELQFNVAHCEARGLVAVGMSRALGIDIEVPRALPERDCLAALNFSAVEVGALQALPESLRDAAFFNCWTRKEAYLKLLGTGIGVDLTKITVGLTQDTHCDVAATLYTATLGNGAIMSVASDRPWASLQFCDLSQLRV